MWMYKASIMFLFNFYQYTFFLLSPFSLSLSFSSFPLPSPPLSLSFSSSPCCYFLLALFSSFINWTRSLHGAQLWLFHFGWQPCFSWRSHQSSRHNAHTKHLFSKVLFVASAQHSSLGPVHSLTFFCELRRENGFRRSKGGSTELTINLWLGSRLWKLLKKSLCVRTAL